jgi:threonine aldolase
VSASGRGFASDNHAGAHPDVLAAIAECNAAHAPAYGADPWTAKAEAVLRGHFGDHARIFPVFNGTAANVLSLGALSAPWETTLCARTAHLHVDECGAPERAGRKITVVEAPGGKVTPETLEPAAIRFGDEHAPQPRIVSIAQSTELGTLYTPEETRALADWAHERGMKLHVDGARLANAAAALGADLAALTTDAGVDAVSLGGTKNGALGAEAVVLLGEGGDDIGAGFPYLRKQSMQLASKMRFVSAQLLALYEGELWRENAAHANAMAARLEVSVSVAATQPVEANAMFAILPAAVTAALQEDWAFYVWDEATGEVRWMCAWDTTAEDVDAFAGAVASATTPA